MIDKSINNIDCVQVRARKSETNQSTVLDDLIYNTTYIKAYNGSEVIDLNITGSLSELEDDVCKAEIDSQILDSALNVYTAPFGKYNTDTNFRFASFNFISKKFVLHFNKSFY